MMTSAYAQRLANVRAEATLITDKMVLELGLSKAQRNGILNINLNYLNGIRSYRDIDSYGWECRNRELRRMLTARQWQRFKEAYYFTNITSTTTSITSTTTNTTSTTTSASMASETDGKVM